MQAGGQRLSKRAEFIDYGTTIRLTGLATKSSIIVSLDAEASLPGDTKGDGEPDNVGEAWCFNRRFRSRMETPSQSCRRPKMRKIMVKICIWFSVQKRSRRFDTANRSSLRRLTEDDDRSGDPLAFW